MKTPQYPYWLKFDSFGNTAYEEDGTYYERNRFTGRDYFPEIGLYYMRNRWYSPKVGRFISEDPIGFSGMSWNLYKYSKNNPVFYKDPLGLICLPWFRLYMTGWKEVRRERSLVELTSVVGTLAGGAICNWIKYDLVYQYRNYVKRKWCFGFRKDKCGKRHFYSEIIYSGIFYEFRETKEITEAQTTVGRIWTQGYDIEHGDSYCCKDPFRGGWVCGVKNY